MHREIGWPRALVNALFALAALGLAALGTLEISRRQWRWQETFTANAAFSSIAGLEVGARVFIQGLDAGAVEAITPPTVPGGAITVRLRVDERLRPLVRSDATARIGTQGIVGAKVLEVLPGERDAAPLAADHVLKGITPRDVADLLDSASKSLARVERVAGAAETGLGEINDIAATIRRGEGTLGRLVKDDEAYRRLLALSDRGETTLQDLSDNLSALKKTWPFTRYFDRRGFDDFDRVLYQPRSDREMQVLTEADLFEPGLAILTQGGRQSLDQVASWFKAMNKPRTSEIVIAAFTDRAPRDDEGLARILTQDQAEAVKAYLVEHHRLQSTGWFSPARKIAAVGFGTQTPRLPDAEASIVHLPARRVEVLVFTPRA